MIDADALIEKLDAEPEGGYYSPHDVISLLMAQPVSEERKTGEWLEVEVFPEVYDIEGVKTWGSEMQCDQCGFRHTAIEGHMAQYNYCPNCGADMRETP